MNVFTIIGILIEAFTSVGDVAIFLIFYYGTRKNKTRYIISASALIFVAKILTQVMVYCKWSDTAQFIIFMFSFIILYGTPSLYDRKKWLQNLVSFEIYLFIHDTLLVGAEALAENMFNYTYDNTPVITDVNELILYGIYNVLTFSITSVPIVLILRKVLPQEKMYRNSLAKNLFWLFQTIAIMIVDSMLGITMEEFDLQLYIRLLVADSVEVLISFYLFTYIYNRHMRKELNYIEKIAENQRKLYEDAVRHYDELSNVRHDLYNYMRTVELVEALGNNTGKYKEQMQEKVNELVPRDYSDVHELNLMLGQAERICAEQNIELQIEVQKLNITETDCMKICMLLRNIIQNVVLRCGGGEPEAVKLCIEQNDAIQISIEGDALSKHVDRKRRKVIRDNRKFIKYVLDKNEGIKVAGSY